MIDRETLDKAVRFYWQSVVHDNLHPGRDTYDLICVAYRRLIALKLRHAA